MDNVVVVDEDDKIVGVMPRNDAHRNGTLHRVVAVYVENLEGQILVQIRMTGRLDHSSAGHVDEGEEYLEAAYRELQEELGISGVSLSLLGRVVSIESVPQKEENRAHMFQVYTCVAEHGVLQPDEVKGVYWADPKEVFQEMKNNPEDKKFSAGFRMSLPLYLEYKNNKL